MTINSKDISDSIEKHVGTYCKNHTGLTVEEFNEKFDYDGEMRISGEKFIMMPSWLFDAYAAAFASTLFEVGDAHNLPIDPDWRKRVEESFTPEVDEFVDVSIETDDTDDDFEDDSDDFEDEE